MRDGDVLAVENMTKRETELQRRLRDVMQARGLRATPTSEAMGLGKNSLGKILRGDTDIPEKESLEAIAAYFGWAMSDVLVWAGLAPDRASGRFDPVQEVDRILLRARVPERKRQWVRDAVRYVLPSEPPSNG